MDKSSVDQVISTSTSLYQHLTKGSVIIGSGSSDSPLKVLGVTSIVTFSLCLQKLATTYRSNPDDPSWSPKKAFTTILYESFVLPLWQDEAREGVLEVLGTQEVDVEDRRQEPIRIFKQGESDERTAPNFARTSGMEILILSGILNLSVARRFSFSFFPIQN